MSEPAVAVAAAICWLSRQPGLPEVAELRRAVTQRHLEGCDWCDWPLPELLDQVHIDGEAARFARLDPKDQRRLVAEAQGLTDLRLMRGERDD